jgi:glycosyltransferase involved in cell wall biosynthesis
MLKLGLGATSIYSDDGSMRQKLDGIGVYTSNLLEEFQQFKDVSVSPCVFSSSPNVFQHEKMSTAGLIHEGNFTINNLLSKRFNIIDKEFDIFHATDYRVPKLKKTPVVATILDAIMLKTPEFANQRFRRTKNFLMKRFMQYADRYIAISSAIIDDLVNYWGVPEDKISVIHCGIASSWLQVIGEEERKKTLNQLGVSKPFFLAVGTLQPRKNFERIIDAFQSLPDALKNEYELIIVGKVGSNCDAALTKIQEAQKTGSVKWLNHIDEHSLKVLYQSSKALVFPSLAEGFGLPILEGFASRIPVITSNLSSMPEIAGNAAIQVDPYQTDEIAEAMNRLVNHSDFAEALIEKGSTRVLDFSWQKCARETFSLYEELC